MQQYQAGEKLRQQTMRDLLGSFGEASQVEARDLATPYIEREKAAELAGRQATTAHTQALTGQISQMAPHEIAKMLAGTAHTTAQTDKIRQEMKDQEALGELPVQIMQEKYNQMVKNGSIADEIVLPDGKKVQVTREELVDIIKSKSGGTKGQLTEQNKITNARNAQHDAEKRLAESEEAESVILGRQKAKDGGTLNTLDPAAQPYADEFNRKSEKPYAYVWGENAERNYVWPNKPGLHKVNLPVANINGKQTQLTAKMLTEIGKASKPPLTIKQVLETLRESKVIKEKLPWQ